MAADYNLNRVNLYEQIADYMEQLILDDEKEQWDEGDKLPPEQELANSFGVSRNVIRESIKILKERGLVEPKNGVGAYITKPDVQKLSSLIYRIVLLDKIDIDSIYDVRILLEEHSAGRAALNCTEDDLAYMRKLLEKMEDRTLSVEKRRETDYEFHVAIAAAAKSQLLLLMISAMRDVFIAMIEKGIFNHGGIEDASKRHSKILETLERHDEQAARDAMRDHLSVSLKQVQKYMNNENEIKNE